MPDPTNRSRVYGEEEIGRILKRATELQLREPSAHGGTGVTLGELEEIALEAGIDRRFLRRAAREVDTPPPRRSIWSALAGEAVMLTREIVLPGELDDGGFERIVAAVERGAKHTGQPSVLGRTLTWRGESPSKSRSLQLVVTSRDGQTSIHLEENLGQLAAGLIGGVVGGGGVGLGMAGMAIGLTKLGSAVAAFSLPVGIVGLAYLGSRTAYRALVGRTRLTFNELFERIVSEAEHSIARAAAAGSKASGPASDGPSS